MRVILLAIMAAALLPAFAQPRAPANADEAYEQVVAARRTLQEAEMAQELGVEPREGERQGLAGGRSRLSEEYWLRQQHLRGNVEDARKRVDEALVRWHQLR
jgi:type II secretory pathway pseudopilin PulG